MATAALPKTFLITLPAASISSNANYIQYQNGTILSPKIGTKRTYSIVSSSSSVALTSSSLNNTKSPSPPALASTWLPATVQRTYKYETADDDDDYEYGDDDSEDQSQYADSDQPPRKRERLTHLTSEEKMFRRKMKNRIAAQTARDRKKALMTDLEETCRRLEEENDKLHVQNSKLRQEHSSVIEENDKLKRLLSDKQPQQPQTQQEEEEETASYGQDDAHTVSAFGPAETINVPLPKEQAKAGWALTWLVASALIQIYSKYCVKSLPLEEQQQMLSQLEQLKENSSLTLEDVLSRSPPEAIEKLRSIIRSYKTSYKKPP